MWIKTMKRKYSIVFEKTESGYSAYVPDLDGCFATGETKEIVEKNIYEAIKFHLEGLKEEDSFLAEDGMDTYLDELEDYEDKLSKGKEPFDYTKWQRNLWEGESVREISKKAMDYQNVKQRRNDNNA